VTKEHGAHHGADQTTSVLFLASTQQQVLSLFVFYLLFYPFIRYPCLSRAFIEQPVTTYFTFTSPEKKKKFRYTAFDPFYFFPQVYFCFSLSL